MANNASITEDPTNWRRNGGESARTILQLFPMTRPEVMVSSSGPLVLHAAHNSLVTAAKAAKAGAAITIMATNLDRLRCLQASPADPLRK